MRKLLTILWLIYSRTFSKIYSFTFYCLWKMRGMQGGRNLSVLRNTTISNWVCNLEMGRGVCLHQGVRLSVARNSRLIIKDNAWISHYSIIIASTGATTTIGSNTMIGGHCNIVSADHDINSHLNLRKSGAVVADITIGDNCWIGANCVITKGVTIGNGSIIGAGSVVTKDIPPMSIAVGSPARVIKERVIKNVE